MNIQLEEIQDFKKFEKFDYCLEDNPDVYIDFKNWSDKEKHGEENEKFLEKALRKLNEIKGKKAFIINMLSSDEYKIYERKNIIVIPSIIKQDNNYFVSKGNIYDAVRRILEACNNGDN